MSRDVDAGRVDGAVELRGVVDLVGEHPLLLVDEDEFQDEHRIYEDVIANQILVDSSYEEIAKVAGNLPEFAELKELGRAVT